jgi:hypothetical protein
MSYICLDFSKIYQVKFIDSKTYNLKENIRQIGKRRLKKEYYKVISD